MSKLKAPIGFFSLPRELRDIVYDECFPPLSGYAQALDSRPKFRELNALRTITQELRERENALCKDLHIHILFEGWEAPDPCTTYPNIEHLTIILDLRDWGSRGREDNVATTVQNLRSSVDWMNGWDSGKHLKGMYLALWDEILGEKYLLQTHPFDPIANDSSESKLESLLLDSAGKNSFYEALVFPFKDLAVTADKATVEMPDDAEGFESLEMLELRGIRTVYDYCYADDLSITLKQWLEGNRDGDFHGRWKREGPNIKKLLPRGWSEAPIFVSKRLARDQGRIF